jgi:hypothetical protein
MRATRPTRWLIATALVALITMTAGAHSIATHKNITAAAVGYLLKAQPRLQCNAAGTDTLTKILQYGAEHEDDNYSNDDPTLMGRYQFHFTPALSDYFTKLVIDFTTPAFSIVLGTLDLGAVNAACTSRQWGGFDRTGPGSVTCTYNSLWHKDISMTNDNTWGNAVVDASKANKDYNGFSEGLRKLGFLIHLIEDQSSPAHALNASHGHVPFPLDILARVDPALKGAKVDVGFPDAMEADPLAGKDKARDVPENLWPAKDPSQLMDAAPGAIFQAMHDKVKQMRYTRESMAVRTARMLKNVENRIEAGLESMAKGLTIPWPIGDHTVAEDIALLKRNVAQAIQREIAAEVRAELQRSASEMGKADQEFQVLGPEAVRLSASLLWKYINETKPAMGSGSTAHCTVK